MKSDLTKRLRRLRDSTGLSTQKFAEAIGWPASSYQYYEGGYKKRHLPDDILTAIIAAAPRLGLDAEEVEALGRPMVAASQSASPPGIFSSMDLPILGRVMGGVGVFPDNGVQIGETLRPLSLIGVKDAYAAYVDGESMQPRYFPGELALVHPNKPVTRGSFVIVQYDDNRERHYTIKQFIKRSAGKIHLLQLNPEGDFILEESKVHCVHRVVGAIDS